MTYGHEKVYSIFSCHYLYSYQVWRRSVVKQKRYRHTNASGKEIRIINFILELPFFAHKWTHCNQILFDSLWPWPLTYGHDKEYRTFSCHYRYTYQVWRRSVEKQRRYRHYNASGKEIKIINFILELSFFAHKWTHCNQPLFDSLWPWPLTYCHEKVYSTFSCHYLYTYPVWRRSVEKQRRYRHTNASGNEIIIIKIIIRNRTKTERSCDFIGRP